MFSRFNLPPDAVRGEVITEGKNKAKPPLITERANDRVTVCGRNTGDVSSALCEDFTSQNKTHLGRVARILMGGSCRHLFVVRTVFLNQLHSTAVLFIFCSPGSLKTQQQTLNYSLSYNVVRFMDRMKPLSESRLLKSNKISTFNILFMPVLFILNAPQKL